ncbi:MAG: hypothetical protein H6610_10405 [Ignavibacteriales bacterium]|nr:hypothetical protein [Ignavibacteriales bacterium]MCB9257737.1 hypothetical protein [Ignavibacteriales bacterium]
MLNEEYLSKGIALGVIDYFQSIHTTKNPYEAIEILKNEKIDFLITDIDFKTIKSEEYIDEIICLSRNLETILLIDHATIKIENLDSTAKIIIQKKPVSLKSIINIVATINRNIVDQKKGEN